MTLFTANGLLSYDTKKKLSGTKEKPRDFVFRAYKDWLITQTQPYHPNIDSIGHSYLLREPRLFHRRAPGNTCLSAIHDGKEYPDYVKAKRNNSKGCGGIMRVASLALNYQVSNIEELDMEGAQIAACTHGHPLGYMSSAVLVHIINRIAFPQESKSMSLKEIIYEARNTIAKLFSFDPYLKELTDIIDLSVKLSENNKNSDLENIHRIGEGWVAEETLGIAIYCALKYQNDFSSGIIASVNHRGDSDSTGAVTGNILGALVGFDGIDENWKKDLELYDVILDIADDLAFGYHTDKDGNISDPAWIKRYGA